MSDLLSLLSNARRNGSGPAIRRFGRSIRYAIADVDRWSNARMWKSVRVPMQSSHAIDATDESQR
jgi:hypothetical protein